MLKRVSGHALGFDERGALSLDLPCVGASEPRDKRKKPLPLGIRRAIVQLHRELADRAREAVWHISDTTHRLVLEPGGNDGSLVDARSAVLAGERMRALLELPIQDVIETVHGGRPP